MEQVFPGPLQNKAYNRIVFSKFTLYIILTAAAHHVTSILCHFNTAAVHPWFRRLYEHQCFNWPRLMSGSLTGSSGIRRNNGAVSSELLFGGGGASQSNRRAVNPIIKCTHKLVPTCNREQFSTSPSQRTSPLIKSAKGNFSQAYWYWRRARGRTPVFNGNTGDQIQTEVKEWGAERWRERAREDVSRCGSQIRDMCLFSKQRSLCRTISNNFTTGMWVPPEVRPQSRGWRVDDSL